MSGFHSEMSASSLERKLICPASHFAALGKQLPSKLDTVTGSAAHEIHERALKTGRKAEEWVLDAIVIEEHDKTWSIVVDDAMASYVQESVDRVNELPGYLWVEQRVNISPITPIPDQTGTADVIKVDAKTKTLYVGDLKYGLGVRVDAYLNPQHIAYAIGALHDICDLFEIERICLMVMQPRLDNWSTWWTTPAELDAIGRFYKRQLARCLEPNPPFVPSKESCRFCAAKFECPARAEQLRRVGAGLFEDLDEITHINSFNTSMPANMPDIDFLSIDDLLAVNKHAEQISGFLRDVKSHLLRLALHGNDVPGMKLVAARATRRWLDDTAERNAANYLIHSGVAPSHVFTIERPSPAHAERLLPAKLRSSLSTWWAKPPGRPQLVSADDARPVYTPRDIESFYDLDADEDDLSIGAST